MILVLLVIEDIIYSIRRFIKIKRRKLKKL